MKIFNINESYFKYQKCFSGITYQYVNQLENIYDKNLMVGDNNYIYCMYNEFDIINNFMVNFNQIDICSTVNLNLNDKYYQIDNAYLRTGHKILLVNQDNPIENDIYSVDSRGYLVLTDDLNTTGKTWRYKAYVKLGDNKTKQFHLINSGETFPTTGQAKFFLDGHGFIIKNIFNYDINSTDSIIPKIVFTDYELARISVNKNFDLYNGFTLPTGITSMDISYHGGEYLITIDSNTSNFISTGNVSGSTVYNTNSIIDGLGYQTYIEVSSTFLNNVSIYDYVKFEVSGNTNLTLYSFIKYIGSTYVILSDYIQDTILNNYYNSPISTYTLTNLQFSTESNLFSTMTESFYAKYFNIVLDTETITGVTLGNVIPIENSSNKYFDYDGIVFNVSGDTNSIYSFNTENHYIKYKLDEHLNKIYSGFTENYEFLPNFILYSTGLTLQYNDNRPDPIIYPGVYGDQKGTLVKVIPLDSTVVNNFKKHTYVNLIDGSDKYKTLIVDVVPNEYFIMETYKSNSGLTETMTGIETIYDLGTISNILYDIFINDDTITNDNYYRLRDDDTRRNIFNGYAKLISEDNNIMTYSTAFLMQDDNHRFILKVYNPENQFNGGILTPPTVLTSPTVLTGYTEDGLNIKYGALYNWYAATDIRGISSNDSWYILSNDENQEFIDYLDADYYVPGDTGANKIKGTNTNSSIEPYWVDSSEMALATNEFGLNFYGSGMRYNDGTFNELHEALYLWSRTGWSSGITDYANDLYALYDYETLLIDSTYAKAGKSLRLVRLATSSELLLDDGTSCDPYVGNDGKVYSTVKIGTLVWINKNLNETLFRDLTPISIVTGNTEWSGLTTDGMCYYDNDQSNGYTEDAIVYDSTIAIISGNTILTSGDTTITERGLQYSIIKTNLNSIVKDINVGLEPYDSTLTNLETDTIYYYRAYAINEETIGYGEILSFKTDLS